jgi:hypothetical protein
VPPFGILFGRVLAFGKNEIERELVPRFLCNPTAIPTLAIGQESFCELVPFTGTVTNTGGATAVHIHLVIKVVTLVPLMAWLSRVREWCA